MIYYTNECVDCGLPCLGDSCPNRNVMHSKCDFCKVENVKLRRYNGYEICEECLLKEFDVVEGTDEWY
jgi:hypothetical protein